jgi:hypothetical protein
MPRLFKSLEEEFEYFRSLLRKKDPTNDEKLLIKLLIIADRNTRAMEKCMNAPSYFYQDPKDERI